MRNRQAEFDEFFRSEETALLRFCWGLTTDSDVARDLAQEAMTRAWRDWDRIGQTCPASWVRTVALNLVRSEWRRNQQTMVLHRSSPDGLRPVDLDLVRALRELTERQREAVVLHHLGDLSVEDCAEAMGLSVPTLKTHLQRGRARLAALLADTDRLEREYD